MVNALRHILDNFVSSQVSCSGQFFIGEKISAFCEHVHLLLLLKMIFSAFHKVQWQHFSGVVDRFKNLSTISLGFCIPKIIHISVFLTELFKKYKGGHFWGDTVTTTG